YFIDRIIELGKEAARYKAKKDALKNKLFKYKGFVLLGKKWEFKDSGEILPKKTQENAIESEEDMIFADGSFRMRNGKWEYRFMYNKKQISVVGETKKECHKKRLEIIEGKRPVKNKKVPTVAEWLDKW